MKSQGGLWHNGMGRWGLRGSEGVGIRVEFEALGVSGPVVIVLNDSERRKEKEIRPQKNVLTLAPGGLLRGDD